VKRYLEAITRAVIPDKQLNPDTLYGAEIEPAYLKVAPQKTRGGRVPEEGAEIVFKNVQGEHNLMVTELLSTQFCAMDEYGYNYIIAYNGDWKEIK
jgi:hypothetical protein